jgi:hypothetical protein
METEARGNYTLTVRPTPEQYHRLKKRAGQFNMSINRFLLGCALNAKMQAPPVMAIVADSGEHGGYAQSLQHVETELKKVRELLFELLMSFGSAKDKGIINDQYGFECILMIQNVEFMVENIEEYIISETDSRTASGASR